MSESNAPAAIPVIDMSQKPAAPAPATPPETKAPEQKIDDRFAAKFAALDRKAKEVKANESRFKTEAEGIRQEAAKAKEQAEQYRNKYGQYESLEETLKNDKRAGLKWLMDKGATVEELSDMLLDEMNPDPNRKLEKTTSEIEKRLMERIAALEGKLTAKEQADLDAQKAAEQANFDKTVTQVKTELKEFIDAASDDYELIKLNGEYETVFDVMQEHYNDQVSKGVPADKIKLLSYAEAAKWTETYLDEQATKQYEAKRAKQAAKPEPVKAKPTSPTLSNTLSTEVQNGVEPKAKSKEESLRKAARHLRFNE